MGVKRPVLAIAATTGAALVLAIAGLLIWFGQTDQGLDIEIFEPPGSVCEEFTQKPYAQAVVDVEATRDRDLELAVAKMRAGYMRKAADVGAPSEAVRTQLTLLADQVEQASIARDYREAAATATALDADLTDLCND